MKHQSSLAPLRFATFALLLLIAFVGPAEVNAQTTADFIHHLTQQEQEVFKEINLARSDPQKYADFLEETKKYYKGTLFKRPGSVAVTTEEGVKAVDEAIAYLRQLKPLPPLQLSNGMCMGAKDQAVDQGQTGAMGHTGFDSSLYWQRVRRYGDWSNPISENIAYDDGTARDVVMSFIVDDGIPGREHRNNLFSSKNLFLGVSCGKHPKFGAMCVCTFAGNFVEKSDPKKPEAAIPVPRKL